MKTKILVLILLVVAVVMLCYEPEVVCVDKITYVPVYIEPEPEPEITIATEPEFQPEITIATEPEFQPEIYNIPLADDLQLYTYNLCEEYDITLHYPLVLAVMGHESRYDEKVISRTNDYGLMQINKVNHNWLREKLSITDFLDAKQNIHAGVYMLSTYLNKYATVNEALMAYNMGEGGARKQWAAGNYSTAYTTKVLNVLDLIISDNYN